MSRIFISHSSDDNAEAVAVQEWLVANGWDDLFLDLDPERGIRAGECWQEALRQATAHCEVFLFLVSPAWVASRWCLAEYLLARNLGKRLMGVVVAPTPFEDLPPEMTEWRLVDLTCGPRDDQTTVIVPPGDAGATVTFSVDGLERLKIGLQSAGLDAQFFAWPPQDDPDRPPYRGLEPLEAGDAVIFHGRDGSVVTGIDMLRGLVEAAPPRVMAILDASDVGKSSFMRAGLLPRLAREDRLFRPLPVIRPERSVLTGQTGLITCLESALQSAGTPANRAAIRKAVAGGADALRPMLWALAQSGGGDINSPALILPIDQGEELFHADGNDEAATFLEILRDLTVTDSPALAVIFTIRTDNFEAPQSAPKLEGIRKVPFDLPPMPRGSYAEVITGPARRLQGTDRELAIEGPLVDAILRDIEAGGARDALPLLAFTLQRLYVEYGGDGDLKLSEYEKFSGVRGSIDAAVGRAMSVAQADPRIPQEESARLALLRHGLILWLAGIAPETGERRRRVAPISNIPDEARPLIDHLVAQRLLTTDVSKDTGEVTVEPAHEALLRQWDDLKGWLKEDLGDLTVLDGIRRAARDWEANRRDAAWLTHDEGGRLETAKQLASREDFACHLKPSETAYLDAARTRINARKAKEQARQAHEHRNRRVIMVASLAASVFLAVLGAVALWNWFEADEQRMVAQEERNDALRAVSLFLTDLANRETAAGYAVTGMLLAMEGLKDARSDSETMRERPYVVESEAALSRAFYERNEGPILRGHENEVNHAAFSPDGIQIVTASDDKTARLWDAATGAQIAVLEGHEGYVWHAAFSPDGRRIVTASRDGTARLWGAATGAQIAVLEGHEDYVYHAAFSPDGHRIVTASWDGTARLWGAVTGALTVILEGHEDYVYHAAFSPDGRRIVTTSYDNTARLWDAATGAQIAVLEGHEGSVWYAAFSPDGTRIVTASDDGTARVWDTASGAEIAVLEGHEIWVLYATFSPDGRRIVTASGDETARLWDAATGAEIAVLRGHEISVWHAAFSPDGSRIVTASLDGTARLWDAATGAEIAVLRGHADEVNHAAFSPNGTRIVTASWDEMAQIWRNFETSQTLIDRAKQFAPRCLTSAQREQYHLSLEPYRMHTSFFPSTKHASLRQFLVLIPSR